MLDALKEGAYFVDRERRITYWNKAAERLTGFRSEEVVGHRCSENILVHVDCQGKNLCKAGCPLLATMEDTLTREAEVFFHHRRGHRVPVSVRTTPLEDDEGNVVGGIELFAEISPEENLRERMAELERRSLLDLLTGVPNRRYLDSELAALFALWQKSGVPFGVLFFDIDHFKGFNDTHGHDIGDRVLETTAKTLVSAVRSFDVIGRWGGEEFVGLFPNAERETLASIGERLRSAVEATWIEADGQRLSVTVSIGGASAAKEDLSAAAVVKRADTMMYRSKQEGRNRVTVG
ncbi:diguanylate cyclase [Aminivibrio sp.]|jgi:diguanylate cyclase (GGDEF)-like protein/PAS domain S-box-containing protein|uniref:sensor domain-containing diguanylate cyclase n=1 Tax=Aminivibrio sp. TaxID=1872489 RepID=UPI00345ED2B7|nr:diguanylate cyclase [Synergistales bacterium]